MEANRFLTPRDARRPRIALSCTASFPDREQLGVYESFSSFRDLLDADVYVPHSMIQPGVSLPEHLTWLRSRGQFVQSIRELHVCNRDYFRTVEPRRFDALVDSLAQATGTDRATLLDRWEFLAACSAARLMRALQIDYIHTWYNYDQSLCAHVASSLLGIPRGISLCEGFDATDWDLKIPRVHLHSAQVIFASNEATRTAIERLDPEAAASRCTVADGADAVAKAAASILGEIERSSPIERGVDAAYRVRDDLGGRCRPEAVPYVVIAAERTGSNLLFEILSLETAHEVFNPNFVETGYVPLSWRPELQRDPSLIDLRARDIPAFLDRLYALGDADELPAMGFKCMYYHGDSNQDVIDYLVSNPHIRVFHVRRRDRLQRFVSLARAEISDSWYKTRKMEGEGGPSGAIEIDVARMLGDFAAQELLAEKYAALFRNHRVLDLEYERFAEDHDTTRRSSASLLEVTLPPAFVRSKKTGKSSLRDAVANFDQVIDAIRADARWSDLVTDA